MRHVLLNVVVLIVVCSGLNPETTSNELSQPAAQERIDALKRELKGIKQPERKEDFERLQVQLARLGEREQLQQVLCEMNFGDPHAMRMDGIEKLRGIGGWFALNSASQFLTDKPDNTQPHSDAYGIHPSLQVMALVTLPHLVANPPIGEPKIRMGVSDYSHDAAIWTDWITKNRDSLKNLSPTGDGLVSSESICKEVLKHDLVNKYYHVPTQEPRVRE